MTDDDHLVEHKRTCLRPCPYCGGEDITVYLNRHHDSFIRCECGMEVRFVCEEGTENAPVWHLMDRMTAAWNKKAKYRKGGEQ